MGTGNVFTAKYAECLKSYLNSYGTSARVSFVDEKFNSMMKRIDLFNSLLKDVWVGSAESDDKR